MPPHYFAAPVFFVRRNKRDGKGKRAVDRGIPPKTVRKGHAFRIWKLPSIDTHLSLLCNSVELKGIVTGWELDSRRLLISLPSHKFIAWTSQIDGFLTSKKATAAALESFLGRMVHTSTIMPLARHFLARLRFRFMSMQPYKSYTLNDTH